MDVFGLKRRICVVPRPHLSAIGLVEMMLWMIVASFGQVVNQQKGTLQGNRELTKYEKELLSGKV